VEAALVIACRLHGGYIVGHAISLGEKQQIWLELIH
jgi:hypothetical protein